MKLTSVFAIVRTCLLPGALLTLTMMPVNAALPTRCLDIHISNPSAPDGTYWIFPNNQAFKVYCQGMATTSPMEYLTLVNTAPGSNFSQYTAGGASGGSNVDTAYTKVRLDPNSLLVNNGDETFSTSTGSLNHGGGGEIVTSMPYATAMDCVGSGTPTGVANIDLTGTPFFVTSSFFPGGFVPSGSATFSSANQVVNLLGGGFCGWESSDPTAFNPFNKIGGFTLQLGYNGLIAPISIKPGSNPPPINIGGNGVIPVAILSTNTFDATQVDPSKVTFGENGTEASPVSSTLEDVNGDGKLDLVLQFQTQQSGFHCGDTAALMKIFTFSNQQYLGFQGIQTICH